MTYGQSTSKVIYQLSRLGAKTSSFDPAGGMPGDIQPADVAIILSREVTEPIARLLLLVKHAGQEGQRGPLEFSVVCWAEKQGWRYREHSTLVKFCKQAVSEAIFTGKCHKCKGRKKDNVCGYPNGNGVWVECKLCKGYGNPRQTTGRARARIVGVGETAWRETWKSRFHMLEEKLQHLERDALEKMAPWLAG